MISNPDFIIKSVKCKSGKTKNVLRRYKGSESVVMIPDGVGKIDDFVFADDIEPNETITKIVIPDSVTEISAYAFAWCKALKEMFVSFYLKMILIFLQLLLISVIYPKTKLKA